MNASNTLEWLWEQIKAYIDELNSSGSGDSSAKTINLSDIKDVIITVAELNNIKDLDDNIMTLLQDRYTKYELDHILKDDYSTEPITNMEIQSILNK